jgi:hypothetical protein
MVYPVAQGSRRFPGSIHADGFSKPPADFPVSDILREFAQIVLKFHIFCMNLLTLADHP